MISSLLLVALGATLDVPPGGDVRAALVRAQPGDVVRLGEGIYSSSLGRPVNVAIEGAGSGKTLVDAPQGEDGAVAAGRLALRGLTLRAGPSRAALKLENGADVTARDVVFVGGAVGVTTGGGKLDAEEVALFGGLYGLLEDRGELRLDHFQAKGGRAGLAVIHGRLDAQDGVVAGPAQEAAVTVAGGEAHLAAVVVLDPGPSGLAVAGRGRLFGDAVDVASASAEHGYLGDCAELVGGALTLAGSSLRRCKGAAVEASGASVKLDGVDAEGGDAGCVVLVDQSKAELQGVRCEGKGPGVVAASGSTAVSRFGRWLGDPAFYVECASGARVQLGYGEQVREPCGK